MLFADLWRHHSELFVSVVLQTSQGKSFIVTALFDTEMDVIFYRHGGLLRYVARTFLWNRLHPGLKPTECAQVSWTAAFIILLVCLQHEWKPAHWSYINADLSVRAGWTSLDCWRCAASDFRPVLLLHHYTRLFLHLQAASRLTWQPNQEQEESATLTQWGDCTLDNLEHNFFVFYRWRRKTAEY